MKVKKGKYLESLMFSDPAELDWGQTFETDIALYVLGVSLSQRIAGSTISLYLMSELEQKTMTSFVSLPPSTTLGQLREYMKYLDELRESGETNMFGAGPYLQRKFSLTEADARKVLAYWMVTFKDRQK